MERFGDLVREAGGADAPDRALGRLRIALAAELERGEDELGRSRSGYDGRPVVAGIAATATGTGAILPVTARLAADLGKEVWACPGGPEEPLGEGPNALLRDGARLVRNPSDLLEDLGLA